MAKGTVMKRMKLKGTVHRTGSFSHGIKVAGSSKGRPAKGRPAKGSAPSATTPFVGFPRPTAGDVTRLHTALARRFGERRPPRCQRRGKILDTIVGTILSQNTTNTNSHRAFQQLVSAFGTWDKVRVARPAAVAAAIKCGGLAPKKTKWIQHILQTVFKERGKTSMEYLRSESKEVVHTELERFPGVGKKTAAIINLFDVGHPDMAVDTHVFRYALQLGWAPSDAERAAHNKKVAGGHWPVVTRDSVYAHLDATFPDKLKYSLHLILTDTEGGLPVVCGARDELAFDGKTITVNGTPLKSLAM